MIVEKLELTFGFRSTIHERNIYLGKVKNKVVYICQQVDDFAIASDSISVGKYIIAKIDKKFLHLVKVLGPNIWNQHSTNPRLHQVTL